MRELDLKPGQVMIFKNAVAPGSRKPLYSGQAMSEAGQRIIVAFWQREARESGQKYLGGQMRTFEPDTEIFDSIVDAGDDRPGQCALFENDKEGVEARPDLRGRGVLPSGEKVLFSVWKNVSAQINTMFLAGTMQDYERVMAEAAKAKPAPGLNPKAKLGQKDQPDMSS